jgi:hypothetical protein
VRLSGETFTEAAEEAGMSRLFGGIHISDGNVGGLKLGQEVAKRAWNKAQTYFNSPGPLGPTSKAECKNGGYKDFGFKNQGQCIKAVNHAS